MQKIKYITAIFIFFMAGGCQYIQNYVPYKYIDNIVDMSEYYCKENKLLACKRYSSCITDQYDQVKAKAPWLLASARIEIYRASLHSGENDTHNYSYINLIANSYKLLDPKTPDLNNLALSVGVSYFIYAHNSCASIAADKTYNIDSYMPLLREKLGVK